MEYKRKESSDTKRKEKNDNNKKLLAIIIVTVAFILLVVFIANPDIFSFLSSGSDATVAGTSMIDSATYTSDRITDFSSDFDTYRSGMSVNEVLLICGTPNKRLDQSLHYYSVYFNDRYIADMTFLFENDLLYGCLYDVTGSLVSDGISEKDYFYLKSYFSNKYGSPVKILDSADILADGDQMYSRWQNDDYLIKLLITRDNGKYEITVGYIAKYKADS